MLIAQDDAALFYRAWGSTLTWVNEQRKIVRPFPPPTPGNPIDPSLAVEVRNTLWADDSLLEQFLSDGADDLTTAERELVASWRHRVAGEFVVFKHLRRHSVLIGGGNVYGVLGIYTPIEVLLPYTPMFVKAVLRRVLRRASGRHFQ